MFNRAISFNQDLSFWNIDSVTDMTGMFFAAAKFNQNLCDWGPRLDWQSPPKVNYMFRLSGCPGTGRDPDPDYLKAGPWCYECKG
jgi:surface protein